MSFKVKKGAPKSGSLKISRDSKILFVCCENIGRSQMGKAIYNQLTKSSNADSTATGVGKEFRKGTVADLEKIESRRLGKSYESTAKLTILERLDVDISNLPRKKLSPDMLSKYDLVVNMAEKWQTPDWLQGDNVIWWNIKDPGMTENYDDRMTKFSETFDEIEILVKELVKGNIIDHDEEGL